MLHQFISPRIFLHFVKFPFLHQAPRFIFIQYCWPYITLINSPFPLYRKSPAIQQLTVLPTPNPPTSCSGCHSSLTSSTCTQDMSQRYVNSLTVSTSSHNFSFCSTDSPIFPSHFQHVTILENFSYPFNSSISTVDPLTTL